MSKERCIKLVVWDLDNTLWDGVLSEGDILSLKPGMKETIEELDRRGILQSVCSKNNYEDAYERLVEFEIDTYFIYPRINWNPKSVNIKEIISSINILPDAVAFIDDSPIELDEVKYEIPNILCINADDTAELLDRKEMIPLFITSDSKIRRQLYLNDIKRNHEEDEFTGTKEEFLATLEMELNISCAGTEDLQRAEELTVRTHQLNSTGVVYSYEELKEISENKDYMLLVAELTDRYGTYGTIGIMLVKCTEDLWTLELLLTSCRVMSRGIGSTLLDWILKLAQSHNVKFRAKFISSASNRIMYLTYKMKGFIESEQDGSNLLFEYQGGNKLLIPDYIKINSIIE